MLREVAHDQAIYRVLNPVENFIQNANEAIKKKKIGDSTHAVRGDETETKQLKKKKLNTLSRFQLIFTKRKELEELSQKQQTI